MISDKKANLENIKKVLHGSSDIVYCNIYIHNNKKSPATIIYIDGMIKTDQVNETILKPLMQEDVFAKLTDPEDIIDRIEHGAVYHASRYVKENLDEVVDSILSANVALVFDNCDKVVIFEAKGFEKRGIQEPAEENVIKGPRDAFTETLRVNTALIRRRVKSPLLRVLNAEVGKEIKTNVAAVYVDGTADDDLVKEVIDRLKHIDVDQVVATSSIEEAIIDHKFSIFPQVIYTERPDKLCASILEGKIAILIDGYPVAYIVPVCFNMFFQTPEDYSQNYFKSSAVRLLRFFCALVSIMLPAFYISVAMFHREMIPTDLEIAIIKSKQSVPFDSFLEVILMLIAFEILIESGVRLPSVIGQAISVVGGLVVGEAAVSAKFVSPVVVVIIAITCICGFIVPNQDLSNSFRLVRLGLVLCAGFAGLYGMSIGGLFLIYYLCTLTSFGFPYMETYQSKHGTMNIRDGIFRLPVTKRGDKA